MGQWIGLPHFITICFAINDLIDFLMSKQLQDQGEVIRVEEELGEILEFEYVYTG
jgi:hypothetical protein